eukprot:s679_g18.t1
MPVLILTDEEKEAALKKGGSDLRFLMERNDVPRDVMAQWFHAGVVTLEKFANIAKDAGDLTEVLKNHLGLDQGASLTARVQVAAVTCAWTNARTRVQRAAEMEAELDTKEFKKPIIASEWLALKSGLEKAVGTVDERTLPAKEYVEKKLQEVEAGDYRAEDLTEVISREEVDPDTLIPHFDSKGNLSVKRGCTRVSEPGNPESLRVRLTVMKNALLMISLKHTGRPELQGDYTRTFEEYKDFLLGEHVWGLNARDAEGFTMSAPPFKLVLSYERAVRREAMRRVNQEGLPIPQALKQAWKDPTTKERHFTTPLALVAKRPAQPAAAVREPPLKKAKGDQKGGRGKGRGKGKQMQGCASHNNEGQPICFRYNTPGEKCKEKKCLRGFTWNSAPRKRKAELGNCLADFSFEAMKRQLRRKGKLAFMEQPEDLGATKHPRVPGHRPGSMWQFPQHAEIAQMEGVQSVALAQLDFGSESVKPTRLLLRVDGPLHEAMYVGMPELDGEGVYCGPLPKKQGVPLIGQVNGQFKTAAAAQWPPQLCEWVAEKIVASFLANRVKEGEGAQSCEQEDRKRGEKRPMGDPLEENCEKKRRECEEEVNPFFPPVSGGHGSARGCVWKGVTVPFHDGGCLLSPGRWDIPKRKYPSSQEWTTFRAKPRRIAVEAAGGESALEKECFAMAGGEKGCKLAQDEGLKAAILEEMRSFCGRDGEFLEVAEGQPFRRRASLRRRRTEIGRPLEWALKEDPTAECALVKPNYPSAKEHEEHLRAHLEAEVEEGLVEKVTLQEFESRYGADRAIAALAVLVEDEDTGKKRVIHDGSHEVRVNHRIRSQDKLRMPGGREKRYLLQSFKAAKSVVFSLIGDFGKAHRRFKYRKEEHGFLGCQVASDDPYVYVNKVGTFGITSTPYWWGRLSGSMIRLCRYLLCPGVPIELLLYADDLEAMGIGREGRKGAALTYIYLSALGAPFKWKKQRGGLCTEWVGLTTDYGAYAFGLSQKRADWLVEWIRGVCKEKLVDPRVFAAGLGRLGFAATALPWEKPFLGPLYVWSSAITGQNGKMIVPWAVLVILDWIANRLEEGGRMDQVGEEEKGGGRSLVVYTDARASDEDACLGGYLHLSDNLKECPWFSIQVTPDLAPWMFSKGGSPKRVIAALELLATLLAVKFWAEGPKDGMLVKMRAFTDNRGNSFALAKGMSTKFPLTILLMELAEELRSKDAKMDLEWVGRDDNTKADDLSNGRIEEFSPELRVEVDARDIGWKVLERLQKRSEELYDGVKALKLQGRRPRTTVPGVNAIIDDGTKETVMRDYVDISIPIPSPRGIISCTLKDAQSMTIRDLEHEIAALSDRAGRDELSVSDLSHSTFGIVDTGVAGSMLGTGIINYPQSASMGTNAVKRRVAVVNGKVEARPIMYTALNYDHRLIDGREAVTFLCSVRDKLEDPSRMLLDL